MTDQDSFLTVREFANKIRVHENTVRAAIKKGKIQAFKLGVGNNSSYRIPTTEAQRLCELDMTIIIEKLIEEKLGEKNGLV